MPGQTANPLTPHRVPFISHRTASYLGLLKRLLHFLMGGKGKKEVLSLRPSCWRGVECLCRSCEQKQQRTRALPDNLCPPMKQLSRSSDWDLSDLAGVSLSSDHVALGETGFCSHQLVEFLHLLTLLLISRTGLTFQIFNKSTVQTLSWSPSKSWRNEAWVPVVPFTPRNLCRGEISRNCF